MDQSGFTSFVVVTTSTLRLRSTLWFSDIFTVPSSPLSTKKNGPRLDCRQIFIGPLQKKRPIAPLAHREFRQKTAHNPMKARQFVQNCAKALHHDSLPANTVRMDRLGPCLYGLGQNKDDDLALSNDGQIARSA
jgi:hypothetical protein